MDDIDFNRFAEQHRDYLRRFLSVRFDPRLAARVDPSDLIQETLVEAYKAAKRGTSRPIVSKRLWLRRIAQNRLRMAQRQHLDTIKRSAKNEVRPVELSSLVDLLHRTPDREATEAVVEQIAKNELLDIMKHAIEQIEPSDRELLQMRAIESLTFPEIEQLTGVKAETARKRFSRALLRLHAKVKAIAGQR